MDERADPSPKLVEGLSEATSELLLLAVLHKSVFTGQGFRALAGREADARVRDALVQVARETSAEAAALSILVHEWDQHPGGWDAAEDCAERMRARILRDLIRVKEGLVEAGLAMAMAAPTPSLRARFLKIVDIDRQHADLLRSVVGLGSTARVADAIDAPALGARASRDAPSSLGHTVHKEVESMRRRGETPRRLVVSAAGARHLRDEGLISKDGLVFDLHLDIDMAWEGEAFAVLSDERVGYAEILSEAQAPDDAPNQ